MLILNRSGSGEIPFREIEQVIEVDAQKVQLGVTRRALLVAGAAVTLIPRGADLAQASTCPPLVLAIGSNLRWSSSNPPGWDRFLDIQPVDETLKTVGTTHVTYDQGRSVVSGRHSPSLDFFRIDGVRLRLVREAEESWFEPDGQANEGQVLQRISRVLRRAQDISKQEMPSTKGNLHTTMTHLAPLLRAYEVNVGNQGSFLHNILHRVSQ